MLRFFFGRLYAKNSYESTSKLGKAICLLSIYAQHIPKHGIILCKSNGTGKQTPLFFYQYLLFSSPLGLAGRNFQDNLVHVKLGHFKRPENLYLPSPFGSLITFPNYVSLGWCHNIVPITVCLWFSCSL